MDSKLKEIDNLLHNLAYVHLEWELPSDKYEVIVHRIEEIRNLLGSINPHTLKMIKISEIQLKLEKIGFSFSGLTTMNFNKHKPENGYDYYEQITVFFGEDSAAIFDVNGRVYKNVGYDDLDSLLIFVERMIND